MKAAALFGAFASPTRLRILNLLLAVQASPELGAQKDLCVCDLCAVLGEAQPKVSRHLATLRGTGLVEVRAEGKWKFYALAQARTPLHRALLRSLRSGLDGAPELTSDRERLASIETRLRCT
jgi:ArsR family transcriptional regulator